MSIQEIINNLKLIGEDKAADQLLDWLTNGAPIPIYKEARILSEAFSWGNSPQGGKYWGDLHIKLRKCYGPAPREETQMLRSSDKVPALGTIIELKPGVKVKVVLNLAQILNKKDTCIGCYFSKDTNFPGIDRCRLETYDHPGLPNYCGDSNAPVEKQVLYILEE